MIQVKNRSYYINESEVKDPYKVNGHYYCRHKKGFSLEISLADFLKLGGVDKE